MNIKQLHANGWWLIAALYALPFGVLMGAGGLWLFQQQWLLWWSALFVVSTGGAYGVGYWLQRRDQRLLQQTHTQPDPAWTSHEAAAWAEVEAFAAQLDLTKYPLEAQDTVPALARETLTRVARHFHPDVTEPLLELTLPHTLLIIEQAAQELRLSLVNNIPFSHQLKLGTLVRAYRWKAFAEKLSGLYQAGQLVINPLQGVMMLLRSELQAHGVKQVQQEFTGWLLRELVRLVGKHAIALYGGRPLALDVSPAAAPVTSLTAPSAAALQQVETAQLAVREEPLRILVLGRANAGKSSLINALFGQLQAATDLLPNTTRALTPYRLQRDGLDEALIFDSPDVEQLPPDGVGEAAALADMILWVTAAHCPDRHTERQRLDALRHAQTQQLHRRAPPLVVVVSHIDRLRPPREWQPPYDLTAGADNVKAMNIQAAISVAAIDLDVPIADVIPVCLAEGRIYNVDDTLWAALLNHLEQAQRLRLLRCHAARHSSEQWALLRRQLMNAGRFLLKIPK
ncbi:GTPase family protein [Thiospirillum jenense]|uniref:50S ribosome-binding GTPase n=1 Tax=Thiospirillum jenense TaxID=1653858 RepID=A0A839HD52_9GAMM|nr:GTPase [Thiospirillum jenense]MBB1125117.1 50S ribosome-binding GTPase [Thiospirillum jenense]